MIVPRALIAAAILAVALAIHGQSHPWPVTAGSACTDTPKTQWRPADGGNGHYYQGVCGPLDWEEAHASAQARRGHLVTIESAAENQFAFELTDSDGFWFDDPGGFCNGPWIGAMQPPGSQEPGGGWQWVTGEPFTYTNWHEGEPNNFATGEDRAAFWRFACPAVNARAPFWNDAWHEEDMPAFIVEWDEAPPLLGDIDCDGDVDDDDFELLLLYAADLIGGQQSAPCPDIGEPVDASFWGDVNCDGVVDAIDALYLLAFIAGAALPTPGGCPPIGQPFAG